jgi:hypothetical protein
LEKGNARLLRLLGQRNVGIEAVEELFLLPTKLFP